MGVTGLSYGFASTGSCSVGVAVIPRSLDGDGVDSSASVVWAWSLSVTGRDFLLARSRVRRSARNRAFFGGPVVLDLAGFRVSPFGRLIIGGSLVVGVA